MLWKKTIELVFLIPPFSNNMKQRPHRMRSLLTDAKLGSNIQDWESRAQVLIAHFRADYALFSNDTRFKELIEDLNRTASCFERYGRYMTFRS
ncbi:hypothetical protein ACFQ88_23755 [Paenibacillus sp. NPDC056579]|uniref:MmyB family transcriptional regulator n=1 Tax=Paenibacillus sp. NPDC056579 TaxID=3345871 RepID=UPI00368AAC1B